MKPSEVSNKLTKLDSNLVLQVVLVFEPRVSTGGAVPKMTFYDSTPYEQEPGPKVLIFGKI